MRQRLSTSISAMPAPLADAVERCIESLLEEKRVVFDTPGHRQGRGAAPRLKRLIAKALESDVSCLEELGTLQETGGALAEAERRAASLYGTDGAMFSTNGTTGLIHAMLLGVCHEGDTILVARNAHRSIFAGLMLSGLRPVYLEPEVDLQLGIARGVAPDTVAHALREHPEAKAVLLVSPTYYGIASDLETIAKLVHEKGIPLLVDEAHGAHLAHFPVSPTLPISAMAAGADVAVQSTHKLLGSLTQTSLLLYKDKRIDAQRLCQANALMQSTSSNYLLLASLDIARLQMEEEGQRLYACAIDMARTLREKINRIEGLYVFGDEILNGRGTKALDPLKLTITVTGLGIDGKEAQDYLFGQGIVIELSDARNILCILSYADGKREGEILYRALCRMAAHYSAVMQGKGTVHRRLFDLAPLPPIPKLAMTPREAYFANTECVLLEEAVGRISGETICFYPPGIPVLCAGEVIDEETVVYVQEELSHGRHLQGTEDESWQRVKVIL